MNVLKKKVFGRAMRLGVGHRGLILDSTEEKGRYNTSK
jgi:hypothetical protein